MPDIVISSAGEAEAPAATEAAIAAVDAAGAAASAEIASEAAQNAIATAATAAAMAEVAAAEEIRDYGAELAACRAEIEVLKASQAENNQLILDRLEQLNWLTETMMETENETAAEEAENSASEAEAPSQAEPAPGNKDQTQDNHVVAPNGRRYRKI